VRVCIRSNEKVKNIAAMPLLVTHRSRSCVAAVDHQKLYGRFHYDPLDMSKYNSSNSNTLTNGRNEEIEEELHDKKHVDEGK
jgi:hypothetical protein